MAILTLIILGLVQGLCEFLPISSSGHLVLLSKVFSVEDSLFVSIILHLATLLALLIVLRKEVLYLVKHPFSKETTNLVIATIFTCLIAIVLLPFINSSFGGQTLPLAFLASAFLLFLVQKKGGKGEQIDFKKAAIIGIVQGIAIFPGLSRSGTTISAGILAGGEKEECAKFSFLLSIPIIFASLFFEILQIFVFKQPISVNWIGLVLAFLTAFIIGIISIKFMLNLTKNLNFKAFSIYLVILAIISAILLWIL